MGEMSEIFNAMKERDKERKSRNLANANLTGFTRHTEFHYSTNLQCDRLDYWPSRNKFMWRKKVYTGDVQGFIKNRQRIEE